MISLIVLGMFLLSEDYIIKKAILILIGFIALYFGGVVLIIKFLPEKKEAIQMHLRSIEEFLK